MFDFDAGKMILVAVVALVVVGPKELPYVLRTLGQAAGRWRGLQSQMRRMVMDVVADADLDDAGRSLAAFEQGLRNSISSNPATAMRATLPAMNGTAVASTASDIEVLQYASPEMQDYLSSASERRPTSMETCGHDEGE